MSTEPGEGRRSISIGGFRHDNPIPAAARIGPFVCSGAITGRDPDTGEMPGTLEEQCLNTFGHLRAIVEAAGATMDDILKVTVLLQDYRDREALNREWLRAFPDPASRPARQAISAQLDGGSLIQCDFLAVITPPAEGAPRGASGA